MEFLRFHRRATQVCWTYFETRYKVLVVLSAWQRWLFEKEMIKNNIFLCIRWRELVLSQLMAGHLFTLTGVLCWSWKPIQEVVRKVSLWAMIMIGWQFVFQIRSKHVASTNPFLIAISYVEMAIVLISQNRFGEAKQYLNKSRKDCNKHPFELLVLFKGQSTYKYLMMKQEQFNSNNDANNNTNGTHPPSNGLKSKWIVVLLSMEPNQINR